MKTVLFLFILTSFQLNSNDFDVATHFGFSLSQQQIKTEIGGTNYPKLFNHGEINFNLQARYNVNDYLAVGGYLRYDTGNRSFSSVLREDELLVINGKNSDFTELWLGPIVTGMYKSVFLSFGYGLSALRSDDYIDITNANGTNTPLSGSPFAWFTHIGGKYELSADFDLVIMVEYRVRYYDELDGSAITNGNKIGMQNITPMIGFEYIM